MRNRTLLFIASLAVAASACQRQPADQQQQPQQAESPQATGKGVDRSHAGQKIPDVQLFNAEEQKGALSEAAGRPLLVNLWASWCAPCVKELPTLDALSRKPGAPTIIPVSEDIGERASVDAFLRGHGIKTLKTWRDPDMALTGALQVQVMPTTIYFDASGREVWRYTGDLDWTGEEAARLLAGSAPGEAR